ncbi:MAG: peptidylprolyl isomerase [Pseudomonadales bacterium]|nr:peptidylprolyl isomerase [Pseudomonadales bacterium]
MNSLNMTNLHASGAGKVTVPGRLGRWLALVSISLGLVALGETALAQRVQLDRVIAIVDDDVVLQSELDARVIEITQSAARANQPLPSGEQFRSDVLDALIIENVQLQLAERISIRFDDDTINRVLNNMAQNNNMSFDEYVSLLEENGVYLQTRDQVRRQMTVQELQRGMVNRRITITDQEIENFLNSEMGKEAIAATYFIDHILIASGASDSPEVKTNKLKYAADLAVRIIEGEDFLTARSAAEAAGRFQVSSTEFGWRKADELPQLFADIVAEMTLGEVEGPIEAGNGYHIIRLAGKQGGTDQMVSQTDVRHIMLIANEIRTDEQTRTAIAELRQKIVDGEDFATLARQNSDDASSVVGGGDLDWINEGGMPPEMQAVVDTMEIGELSEPFKTESGWHIAEVLGRRIQDFSQDYTRNQAENALRDRKFDLEMENWLIEIREKAFVELID